MCSILEFSHSTSQSLQLAENTVDGFAIHVPHCHVVYTFQIVCAMLTIKQSINIGHWLGGGDASSHRHS
jgi:hypothetical protein